MASARFMVLERSSSRRTSLKWAGYWSLPCPFCVARDIWCASINMRDALFISVVERSGQIHCHCPTLKSSIRLSAFVLVNQEIASSCRPPLFLACVPAVLHTIVTNMNTGRKNSPRNYFCKFITAKSQQQISAAINSVVWGTGESFSLQRSALDETRKNYSKKWCTI